MLDLAQVEHHPALEEMVEVLCNKTQNTDRGFFRVEVAYFMAKAAAAMRASVVTKDRGEIPVNIYALALANSGYGKGHSVNIMETEFLGGFKRKFMNETLPAQAEYRLSALAHERASKRGQDPEDVYQKLLQEYERTGTYPFTFDSATAPAIKQLRHKLQLAEAGSINMQIDEIGSNLLQNEEALTVFLELYDQGLVKSKLIKNTAENVRAEELDGKTPTNMLLFGTPSKLLDGGQTEEQFYSLLETGYARRCLFGWGHQEKRAVHQMMTAEEIYQRLIQPSNSAVVNQMAQHFEKLADVSNLNRKIVLEDSEAIKLLEYRMACEMEADLLPEHEEIRKAELAHRYFKALKLAGTFAFFDGTPCITMHQLHQAILLVEESGEAFRTILSREKSYVRLAKYIVSCETAVTHADLVEALPFYKSGLSARNEQMSLAMAWAHRNHMLIKRSWIDSIEFFEGEALEKTNLDEMILSYGTSFAYDYESVRVPFDQLHVAALGQQDDGSPFHWLNHALVNGHNGKGHRAEDNVIPGFNLLVLDVDGGTPMSTAMELMKDYQFFVHTTKRHTPQHNRFRMVLPINYHLELDADEYHEFMDNVMGWLPFQIDDQGNLRSKKWESNPNGQYTYNLEGEILDVLQFIPKTAKNEQYQQQFKDIQDLSNLERWFAQRMKPGNRNNQLLRYALALVDTGLSYADVQKMVHSFNERIQYPLRKDEINSTILRSVAKRYQRTA